MLLGWWAGENVRHRHLWPGINVGRGRGAGGAEEAVDQIMVTRGMLPDDPGTVHWSVGPLARSDTLATTLLDGPYLPQALVPASPWLDARPPAPPSVAAEWAGADLLIGWAHPDPGDVFTWVVYFRGDDAWSWRILPRHERQATLEAPVTEIAISAVDRSGNESRPTFWRSPKTLTAARPGMSFPGP